MTPHLRSIGFRDIEPDTRNGFPFTVPAFQTLLDGSLEFPTPVTLFVGENGSGKSTLLESLAYATEMPTAGTTEVADDPSLKHARELGEYLRLRWSKGRTHRGLYLRAEDFFGFAKRMDSTRAELQSDLDAIDQNPDLSEQSRAFARMAFASQLGELQRRYGEGIDTKSHGEQFLSLFGNWMTPNGLHLIDEPEAPLSPSRILTLISMIRDLSRNENAQFIIATHSPLLMAIPDATIYEFGAGGIKQVSYNNLEHVRITRDFLNDPESFLRYL